MSFRIFGDICIHVYIKIYLKKPIITCVYVSGILHHRDKDVKKTRFFCNPKRSSLRITSHYLKKGAQAPAGGRKVAPQRRLSTSFFGREQMRQREGTKGEADVTSACRLRQREGRPAELAEGAAEEPTGTGKGTVGDITDRATSM